MKRLLYISIFLLSCENELNSDKTDNQTNKEEEFGNDEVKKDNLIPVKTALLSQINAFIDSTSEINYSVISVSMEEEKDTCRLYFVTNYCYFSDQIIGYWEYNNKLIEFFENTVNGCSNLIKDSLLQKNPDEKYIKCGTSDYKHEPYCWKFKIIKKDSLVLYFKGGI